MATEQLFWPVLSTFWHSNLPYPCNHVISDNPYKIIDAWMKITQNNIMKNGLLIFNPIISLVFFFVAFNEGQETFWWSASFIFILRVMRVDTNQNDVQAWNQFFRNLIRSKKKREYVENERNWLNAIPTLEILYSDIIMQLPKL